MRNLIMWAAVVLAGIVAGLFIGVPIVDSIRSARVVDRDLYAENPPTTPPQSISHLLFSSRVEPVSTPTEAHFNGAAGLSIGLLSRTGESLVSPYTDTNTDFHAFVQVWNHTDKQQKLGLVSLIDYATAPIIVDGIAETSLYEFQLGPNEFVEIPVQLRTSHLEAGLHELDLIVVRRPRAFANEDQVAEGYCCMVSRAALGVGVPVDALPVQAAGSGEIRHSLSIDRPIVEGSSIEVRAGIPMDLLLSIDTTNPWKFLLLVDYETVFELGGSPDVRKITATIPALAAGRHEAVMLTLLNPIDHETGSGIVQGKYAQRFTVVARP